MPRIPPLLVVLLGAVTAVALARYAPILRFSLPAQQAVALAFAAAGVVIMVWAVAAFRRARTTVDPVRVEQASALVTAGPFAWTRNPMYLGMAMVLAGLAVWLGALSALAVPAFFVGYIDRLQIRAEEAFMREQFGAEFAAYAARTRRWL